MKVCCRKDSEKYSRKYFLNKYITSVCELDIVLNIMLNILHLNQVFSSCHYTMVHYYDHYNCHLVGDYFHLQVF